MRATTQACVLIPLYNHRNAIVAWAWVDAADAGLVKPHRWRRTHYGYARTGAARAGHLMHRLILGLESGDARQGDHRDGNRLDCRRSNLRVVTNAQNAQNQASKGGTSAHRGASWRKDTGRWTGYVKVNYRRHVAGCFATEQEAVTAVLALRARLMPYDEPSRHA